jgi:hypothetical protein
LIENKVKSLVERIFWLAVYCRLEGSTETVEVVLVVNTG